MPADIEPVKKWFGYNRKERRASFILLIIIALILFLRTVIPEKNMELEDVTAAMTLISLHEEEKPVATAYTYDRSSKDTVYRTAYRPARPVQTRKYPASQKQREKIELNSCDTSLLVSLPGIGPVLSVRIIKYRNLLGGFATVSQLQEVYGLSPETFDIIKDRLTADTTLVKKISINTAEYKELARMPYFEKYEVSAILKYRELSGKIKKIGDLTDNKILTAEKAEKVRGYMRFD